MHDLSPAPAAGPADLAPPSPGRRTAFHLLLALATFSVNATLLTATILTLSLKSTAIDAGAATTILSVTASVGAVFTIVGYPLMGRLSDRTLGRFGRRRPYLVGGAVALGLGSLLLVQAASTPVLVVGHALLSVGYVTSLVAASALVPDQVPVEQRGTASSIVGLSTPVGALLGLFVAQLLAPDLTAMILVPGALGVVGSLALAFGTKDAPLARAQRPAFALRDLAGTFWVDPRTAPGFAWAWLSRILLFLGVSAVNAYQAFYLIMVQHVTPAEVAGKIFVATAVVTGTSLVLAPVAARVSDRIGRRKPFVLSAAVVFAAGLALVTRADGFGEFLVAMAVMGAGQGVYLAVDFALVTQVLPDPTNPAKDLGIMNLANTLPASIVPAVAPAVLAIGAGPGEQNFAALFGLGALAALLGAAAVLPIRGVR
ncbi:MFS transporter [Cellulomonas sp. SLBN-39]|uniref:MFS transporter n=1 Tax=Cellulomonas sp. SLBN-39 TaxID=2768446 RepID=UPI00114EDB0E|nr:MFS transporter [Cellulomonas sp. SLBN-39]TQL02865.1 Na+/melibiose symporter-like transporter [Cellulomonas sp. SLBN-39]